MADQDCSKINLPLALSSSNASLWDLHHYAVRATPSTSLWNNTTGDSAMNLPWESYNNSNLSPCDQEDVSSITADESSHQIFEASFSSTNNILGESAADDNSPLWNQLLPGIGASQETCSDEMGEKLLNALSSKSFYGGMIEPSPCSFFTNSFDKQSNSNVGFVENNDQQRLSIKLSSSKNLVNSWSTAPPPDQPQMIHHLVPHPCSNNIPSTHQYLHPDITSDQKKQFDLGPYSSFGCANPGMDQMRPENYGRGESTHSSPGHLFPSALFINSNEYGYRPVGANWRPRESNLISQHGFIPSFIDPFRSSHSRLLTNKPVLMLPSLADAKKQQGTPSNPMMNKGNGRAFTNEGKKKRLDDNGQSSGSSKKPRHESSSSNPSTAKMTNTQTPKSKIEAEKLSALQQIVSPYGKTDTASVLQEAIECITRLHENVQLLSNPYLKSSATKLQEAWGSVDRKFERGEKNKVVDLKIEGLCLVPISSIPRDIKEDNSGPDYCWPSRLLILMNLQATILS